MHSTRNQNPALAPFLRVAFEASALACPCSGGLACLRRSNVARQERPAVPRYTHCCALFLPDGSAVPVFVPTLDTPLRKFRFRRRPVARRVALRCAVSN